MEAVDLLQKILTVPERRLTLEQVTFGYSSLSYVA
jgi:hypothetical protein